LIPFFVLRFSFFVKEKGADVKYPSPYYLIKLTINRLEDRYLKDFLLSLYEKRKT